MTISDLALRIRVEPIAHLHERAETLGVGCKWTGWGRARPNAAAVAALAAARRPHRPVASADTDIEIFGDAVSQDQLCLHAASGTVLREERDWHSHQMTIEPSELSIRQVGYVAVDC